MHIFLLKNCSKLCTWFSNSLRSQQNLRPPPYRSSTPFAFLITKILKVFRLDPYPNSTFTFVQSGSYRVVTDNFLAVARKFPRPYLCDCSHNSFSHRRSKKVATPTRVNFLLKIYPPSRTVQKKSHPKIIGWLFNCLHCTPAWTRTRDPKGISFVL